MFIMRKSSVLIPFVAVLVALMSSCNLVHDNGVDVVSFSSKGFDGAPSCKMTLDEFSVIESNIPLSVDYCRSEEYKVVVLGDTTLVDSLKTEIRNGKLALEMKPGTYHDLWLKVLVYAPRISALHQNGSGQFLCDSVIDKEGRFDVVASGSGDITIKGVECKDVQMEVNGSGNLQAEKVMSQAAVLSINGSGSIRIPDFQVEEKLDANINGSGDISVDGSAQKVKANVNGSGSITGKLKHLDLESSKMGSGSIDLKKE